MMELLLSTMMVVLLFLSIAVAVLMILACTKSEDIVDVMACMEGIPIVVVVEGLSWIGLSTTLLLPWSSDLIGTIVVVVLVEGAVLETDTDRLRMPDYIYR